MLLGFSESDLYKSVCSKKRVLTLSCFGWVDTTGSIHTQINYPGWGLGIAPYWFNVGKTHGVPGHALGLSWLRDNFKLGHLYGSGRLNVAVLFCLQISCNVHLLARGNSMLISTYNCTCFGWITSGSSPKTHCVDKDVFGTWISDCSGALINNLDRVVVGRCNTDIPSTEWTLTSLDLNSPLVYPPCTWSFPQYYLIITSGTGDGSRGVWVVNFFGGLVVTETV